MISVGRRLTLALLPAIFGLAAAVALAYYGQYHRQAPEWFVVVALVSTVASMAVAWFATRHVVSRIERLADWRNARGGALQRAAAALQHSSARIASPSSGLDELDTIEGIVDRLTTAYNAARSDRNLLMARLETERQDAANLVRRAADDVVHGLEEVRLPLHILLENRFGELNDNQEEMLGAARTAAEAADQTALRLRDIAELDLGTLHLRSDTVRLSDLLETIIPGLRVEASQRDVQLHTAIGPALPPFSGDRERLQEALSLVLRSALRAVPPRETAHLTAEAVGGDLHTALDGVHGVPTDEGRALAWRIVHAHGGRIVDAPSSVAIVLPLKR